MRAQCFEVARQAFQTQSDCLLQALASLDESAFCQAVEALSVAPRIAASGCGHSGIACRHFAHLMCCIGRPARFISPSEAVHGASGYLLCNDVLLLASRGGRTSELIPILDICKTRGVKVITVTENPDSLLALGADILLCLNFGRETDRYNSQGTTSNTVFNVLFDAIQAALIEELDFNIGQFATLHPAGAVGERLSRSLPGGGL